MLRVVALILVLFAAGCNKTTPPPNHALRIAFSTFPTTTDPRKCGDFISSTVVALLYEGLTRCLPDGSAELALAKKLEISSDSRVYTFYLRKSYWTDGTMVTARDFEKTWKQHLDPRFPSLCSYLFYPILNAEKAFHQTVSIDEVGIKALDDLTLQVTLERPTPYFLSLTAFPSFLPIPEHQTEISDQIDLTQKTVNGPYFVEKIVSNALIVLKKNPSFWNPKSLKIDEIQINIIPNDATTFALFERGELDWLGGILSPVSQDALESQVVRDKIRYFPISASSFFSFNTKSSFFSNKNIRKAFSHAIDRAEIANEILLTQQIFATRIMPPTLCLDEGKEILPSFDPQIARNYLQKGLEELNLTFEELEPIYLHYRGGPADKMIAQVVQRRWKDVLGIEVQLIQTDFKTHKDLLHSRNYQIAIANWVAQYHDPLNILERFKNPSNAKNYAAWDDPKFSDLIDQIQLETDPVRRMALLAQAEERMAEELPILPIYHWSSPSLCSSRLRNMHTTPSGGVLFERCWLSE